MRRHLLGMLVGLALVAIGAAGLLTRPAAKPLPDLGRVGDFRLTERSGETVSRADLEGKVWVASFVFTCCTGACPQISATMSELHGDFADEPDLVLVSFSVDPKRDTPAVLKSYAKNFGASRRWLFLTGGQDEIYKLITDSFHLSVQQNSGKERTPGNEVTHSSRLVLVDRRGRIRAYVDGRRVDAAGQAVNPLPELREKVAQLLAE